MYLTLCHLSHSHVKYLNAFPLYRRHCKFLKNKSHVCFGLYGTVFLVVTWYVGQSGTQIFEYIPQRFGLLFYEPQGLEFVSH